MRSPALLLLVAAPAVGSAADFTLAHDPVACVRAERFPEIRARVDPPERVAARVRFRPAGGAHWYSVRMERGEQGFRALLPRPKKSLEAFAYYVEATDESMASVRTEEFTPVVAEGPAACEGRVMAPGLAVGKVTIETPAGAPSVPAGFSSSGVASMSGAAAGAATPATAGVTAGTVGVATAGAAAGGGGGTTLLVVGGVAAAAGGAAAVVSATGGEKDGPVRVPGNVLLGDCTCIVNRPPPYPATIVGPIQGAVVSTNLTSDTTTSDAAGHFELVIANPPPRRDDERAMVAVPGCAGTHTWQVSRSDNPSVVWIVLQCAFGPPIRPSCSCPF